jgi:hypothetical protein
VSRQRIPHDLLRGPYGRRVRSRLLASCHVAIVLAVACSGAQAVAQEEIVYQDEEVKAAFIYHFATFVQWPQMSPPGEAFTVAVLGDDEVAAELEAFLPGRAIQGLPMEVRRLDSIDELGDAAVLFIGAKVESHLAELIRQVEDRPMLVVTDAPGALKDGAMINFQVVDDRVRFEISLVAAERAGLELSSRLLSAAMFVDTTSAVPPTARMILASSASPANHR